MVNQKFKPTENQKYVRGLLFVSAGAFMVIRFAGGNGHPFFVAAAWLTAIVALIAFVLYVWSVLAEFK